MKTFKIFALVFASMMLFSGCDEDLFDVSESFTFEHEFVVLTNDAMYNDQSVVNLAELVTLIADYGSKIKQIEIVYVKYWIKNHNGSTSQQLNTGSLEVGNPDGSDLKTIAQVQNVNLSSILNNQQELTVESAGRTKLENSIKTPSHTFLLKFNAAFNEVPADCTVVFEFKVKMVANPLNK